MDRFHPAGRTLAATDSRERAMSLDEHPAQTGHSPGRPPGRGRGERLVITAGVLITLLSVIGILAILTSGDDNDKRPTAPPRPSAPAMTSPAPEPVISVPPKPEDVAADAAKATFLEYVRVRDQVAQGGYENLELYDAVAIDPERTELALEARRTAAVRATGDSEVATLGVESVELTTDPERSYSEVRLRGCLDVQQVEAFKADGTTAVTATRLPRIAFNVLVQEIPASAFNEPGRAGGWYVAKVEYPGGGTAC